MILWEKPTHFHSTHSRNQYRLILETISEIIAKMEQIFCQFPPPNLNLYLNKTKYMYRYQYRPIWRLIIGIRICIGQ